MVHEAKYGGGPEAKYGGGHEAKYGGHEAKCKGQQTAQHDDTKPNCAARSYQYH